MHLMLLQEISNRIRGPHFRETGRLRRSQAEACGLFAQLDALRRDEAAGAHQGQFSAHGASDPVQVCDNTLSRLHNA
jgi:hypothetical protein